jgi:hypothetical protein
MVQSSESARGWCLKLSSLASSCKQSMPKASGWCPSPFSWVGDRVIGSASPAKAAGPVGRLIQASWRARAAGMLSRRPSVLGEWGGMPL